ncbi:META domain-containing protein [Qipengyuania aquimaris]|uniref:META domain-containing protein n=1 Tax=Qipengyuania aquimaris TaxID=255984 RepID=A0A9Q3XD26_9SPHN|nr:META domain-containing protein [Qipengyuania aquimaris]MBY6217346.1 META domain-containing protein [Qipengyuania aquimaris]
MKTPITVITLAAMAAGCSTYEADNDPGLVGSEWELAAFISMDDSIGRIEPKDDQRFSIAFGDEGSAAMQLDCNRGTANYTMEETGETNGRLTFGPIASTRAMCPDPQLGDIMARQLPNVVSYALQDGKLSLALKMDGGIFEFVPAE